jgi:hypothetical protein
MNWRCDSGKDENLIRNLLNKYSINSSYNFTGCSCCIAVDVG